MIERHFKFVPFGNKPSGVASAILQISRDLGNRIVPESKY